MFSAKAVGQGAARGIAVKIQVCGDNLQCKAIHDIYNPTHTMLSLRACAASWGFFTATGARSVSIERVQSTARSDRAQARVLCV